MVIRVCLVSAGGGCMCTDKEEHGKDRRRGWVGVFFLIA